VLIGVHSWLKQNPENYMRELLILLLIAAVAYLAYDDYYKQRPALEQARASIQQLTGERDQLRQNPVRLNPRAQTARTPPAWFQKRLDDGSSSLDAARRHRQKDEAASPHP